MDEGKREEKKTGSVQETLRMLEANATTKKNQVNNPEKSYKGERELHMAKRESQKTVRDLARGIEESNSKVKTQTKDLEKEKAEAEIFTRELGVVKKELSKLKLEMASLSHEKIRAEKEMESSLLKAESHLSSIRKLSKEIEEVEEEHVLVELARIEAVKEYIEIEARRREEAKKHSLAMEETRRKKTQIIREIEDDRELETKLVITISDVNALDGELKQVKEMNARQERKDSRESYYASLLKSVTDELEEAKKELGSVRDETIRLISSMDVVRDELRHVKEEKARFKKREEKAEMTTRNLNAKLLRARVKLEAASVAEDKAKAIVSNLEVSFGKLTSEAESARKERSLIIEEIATLKEEVQRTETEIDEGEERLRDAFQELKAVKSSEAAALENLKEVIERTKRNRDSVSRRSSNITISEFEYAYLTGRAARAKEIAEKKVAAAEAWIQALKASEKEILMKIEKSRRESREIKAEKAREDPDTEQSKNEDETGENEFEIWRRMMEPQRLQPGIGLPGRAMNRSIKLTPIIRTRSRRTGSPRFRFSPRSASFKAKRKRSGLPNLVQFFSRRSIERNASNVN